MFTRDAANLTPRNLPSAIPVYFSAVVVCVDCGADSACGEVYEVLLCECSG